MAKKVERIDMTPFQETVDRFMSNYGEKGHALILEELMGRIASTSSTTQLHFFLADILLITSYCIRERINQIEELRKIIS